MSQRRFHSKSRHGCQQCKKNRTKCDETQPQCGRCKRIGAECSLSDATPGLLFIQTQDEHLNTDSLSGDNSTSSSRSFGPSIDASDTMKLIAPLHPPTERPLPESQFTDLERERLKLMNYYTLHTSKSITEITIPEGRDQLIWSEWVPELALKHDFLLHGLLGLTALHMALQNIYREKNLVLAVHHHGIALGLFWPQVSNITPENTAAVLGFSCLIAFYSFGIHRSSEFDLKISPITRMHEVLTLVRGASVVVKADHAAQTRSRWVHLMLPGYAEGNFTFTQSVPADVENTLAKLLERTSTSNNQIIYITAIQALRDNLATAIKFKNQIQLTFTLFTAMAPVEFWALLEEREPLALAILANYAVVLFWLRKNIWMQGWGKETVEAVREALPVEWHECIAWAIKETEAI